MACPDPKPTLTSRQPSPSACCAGSAPGPKHCSRWPQARGTGVCREVGLPGRGPAWRPPWGHRLPSTACLPLQDHPVLGPGEVPGGELHRRGARACQVRRQPGGGSGSSPRAVGCGHGLQVGLPHPRSCSLCPGPPTASLDARHPRPALARPRSVLFNPDGCCLYSGCQDSLRVYGWEPERCFDVVLVGWGKVADLAVCNDQLVREPPLPFPRPPAACPSGPQRPPQACWGPARPSPSSAASCR